MEPLPPKDGYPLHELRVGRLFIHKTFTEPIGNGPLYGRVVAWTDRKVEYDLVHHNNDGSERLGRWNMIFWHFFNGTLGGWYDGSIVPVPQRRNPGLRLPMTARREGASGPGSG